MLLEAVEVHWQGGERVEAVRERKDGLAEESEDFLVGGWSFGVLGR